MRLLYKIWLPNSPGYKRRISSSTALEYFNIYFEIPKMNYHILAKASDNIRHIYYLTKCLS